jgi:PAS domain S-box-containing protein
VSFAIAEPREGQRARQRSDMAGQSEHPSDQIRRLQRCVNDLLSVLAFPAIWTGGEPSLIIRTLLDSLLRMLHMDLIYARLNAPAGEEPIEMARISAAWETASRPQEIATILLRWLGGDPQRWPPTVRGRIGDEDISIVPFRLGLHGEAGLLLAASRRADFPEQTERLVLSVAANHATIGLQEAQLLKEQKRLANELDERVVQRTRELSEANQELRKEIAERQRKEEELRRNQEALREAHAQLTRSEERWRSVFENSAIGVGLADMNGRCIAMNPVHQEMLGYSEEELLQLRFLDFTFEEDRDRNWTLFEELLAGKRRQFQIEKRYRRKDGSLLWVRNNVSLVASSERVPRFLMTLSEDITERKRAEEALRESEYESRLIVDTIPGLVAVLNENGGIEFVSEPLLQYYGKSLREMQRWGEDDTIHEEDRLGVIEAVANSLTSGDPVNLEARLRRFDGVYRWFQVRGQPLRTRHGDISRWYFLQTDVDDRKRAEEGLKVSESRFRAIIDAIPTMAWSTNPDGYCDFVNRRWLEVTGLSAEQVHGWGWQVAIHPDDLNDLAEAWRTALVSGTLAEPEARMRRFDGTYRWFLFRANPLRDESGKIVKWYGTNIDIDDRKQAEDRLRRNEEVLAKGQRLSVIGSFSWRVDTNEIVFSDEAYRIFGLQRDAPVTMEQIADRVYPEDLWLLAAKTEQARGPGGAFDYEIRLRMPDGSVKYLRTLASDTKDVYGQREYVGAIQDVTQRRQAEEALNKARSELHHVARATALNALTASIAHEVNQPLSGIVTNASTCLRMLDANPPNVEGARETARRTIRDGNRASEVITRLRALFSKKEAAFEAFDLNEAAEEVIALSVSELQRSKIILQHDLAPKLPQVLGDRIQIQQVVLNLIRNASDAMGAVDDRPRELLIKTEHAESGGVRLSVKDTGVGLQLGIEEKLFEAFYTTKNEGMGIGLSVSRSIIEAHRGRLWATANDGPGATFSFSIPCAQTGAAMSQTAGAN